MFDPKTVSLGIAPIGWCNDDMPELGGENTIALGSDFDGMNAYPVDMKNWSDVPNLFDELQRIGFSDKEIRRIAYDNLHDYIIQFVD